MPPRTQGSGVCCVARSIMAPILSDFIWALYYESSSLLTQFCFFLLQLTSLAEMVAAAYEKVPPEKMRGHRGTVLQAALIRDGTDAVLANALEKRYPCLCINGSSQLPMRRPCHCHRPPGGRRCDVPPSGSVPLPLWEAACQSHRARTAYEKKTNSQKETWEIFQRFLFRDEHVNETPQLCNYCPGVCYGKL